jgi:hypothetical protein
MKRIGLIAVLFAGQFAYGADCPKCNHRTKPAAVKSVGKKPIPPRPTILLAMSLPTDFIQFLFGADKEKANNAGASCPHNLLVKQWYAWRERNPDGWSQFPKANAGKDEKQLRHTWGDEEPDPTKALHFGFGGCGCDAETALANGGCGPWMAFVYGISVK